MGSQTILGDRPAESSASEPLAIVRTYAELHNVLRARAKALAITRTEIDVTAGTQFGYAGKLLAPEPIKRLGPMSFGAMLGALGLELWVIEDPKAMERIGRRPGMHTLKSSGKSK